MVKSFAEFLYPGIIRETYIQEVAQRDPAKVEIPCGYVSFRFFDRTVLVVDGEELTGPRKNFSCWYWRGEEVTPKQLKRELSTDQLEILAQMEEKGIKRFVRTEIGILPLGDQDTVLTT